MGWDGMEWNGMRYDDGDECFDADVLSQQTC